MNIVYYLEKNIYYYTKSINKITNTPIPIKIDKELATAATSPSYLHCLVKTADTVLIGAAIEITKIFLANKGNGSKKKHNSINNRLPIKRYDSIETGVLHLYKT